MGGGGSTLRQEILNNIHYNSTTEFFQRNFSNSTTRVQTVNGIRVVLRAGTAGGDSNLVINGGVNIDQINGVTVDVINKNESILSLEEVQELQAALKADTEITQNQLNEDFGGFIGAIGNGNNAATTLRNEVLTVINTTIDQKSVSNTNTDVVNMNEVQMEITTPGDLEINGGVNITQNIVIEVISRTLVNNVINAALSRQSVIDILNESTVAQTQKNTGVATIAQRIGEWFNSTGFIVFLVIVIIIVGTVIYFKVFRGKGLKNKNVTQVPAQTPVQIPPQQFQQLQQLQQQQMLQASGGLPPPPTYAPQELYGSSPNPSARASPRGKQSFSAKKSPGNVSGRKLSQSKAVKQAFNNANKIARAAPVSQNARAASAANRASAKASVANARSAKAASAKSASPRKLKRGG